MTTELPLIAGDDPESLQFFDEHADTTSLLVASLIALQPQHSLPSLLAAEAGRCVTLRHLLADNPIRNLGATSTESRVKYGDNVSDALEEVEEDAPGTAPGATPSVPAGPALISTPEHVSEALSHLGEISGKSGAKSPGMCLYYALLEADRDATPPKTTPKPPPGAQGDASMQRLAEADAAEAEPEPPDDEIILWVLDGEGKCVLLHRTPARAKDGRSFSSLLSDYLTKVSLSFEGHLVRGQPE